MIDMFILILGIAASGVSFWVIGEEIGDRKQ